MPPVSRLPFAAGAKPKGRPAQGNSPDDRIPRGPDCHRLKRVCADLLSACAFARLHDPAGPQDAFSQACGIYLVRCSSNFKTNLRAGTVLPPAGRSRAQRKETRREDHVPSHRPQMSSGRLFLDRVGRHQSPSPLHRPAQLNMHSRNLGDKADISTLPESGHFYFALTRISRHLPAPPRQV
jgi:hypothetical protein